MRKFGLFFLFVLMLTSCRVFQHYSSYIEENNYNRLHLKKMWFKESFDNSMSKKIDTSVIYSSFYEDVSVNYTIYTYLRLFDTGQYALFFSKEKRSDFNLQKARFVGYYNVKADILYLEIPNTIFSKSGKRIIEKYKILSSGNLESIERKKVNVEFYQKTKFEILLTTPDW